jgi:VIT1/CCC1 family predicted Fe2+/Mn2+ transporter
VWLLTQGVANLIADAISMGMGDFISDKAEQVQNSPPPPDHAFGSEPLSFS